MKRKKLWQNNTTGIDVSYIPADNKSINVAGWLEPR